MTEMGEPEEDGRFRHISKDPRFRKMQRDARKVKIDRRFQSMFNDKSFKVKYTVDKRGRPIHSTTNENLRRYYELSDSEESSDAERVQGNNAGELTEKAQHGQTSGSESGIGEETCDIGFKSKEKAQRNEPTKSAAKRKSPTLGDGKDVDSDSGDSEKSEVEEKDELDESSNNAKNIDVSQGPDYARGEGILSSSEEDSESDYDEENFDHQWGELDKDAPESAEISCRLAVCNMDWDQIKAQDILVLLSSFTPPGGVIKAVKVYPSEFGLKRMADEEVKGPTELVEKTLDKEEEDIAENEEGSSYHREKLRQYQLNRLKYYYAVAEFDSANTANHVYTQCDGIEYESSATRLDLRFIPDHMTFDEVAKSEASSLPDAQTYMPSLFLNSALQQSQVHLTWDVTDKDRLALTMKKYTAEDVEHMDVRDYLASDSDDEGQNVDDEPDSGGLEAEEEEESEEAQIQKYRQLLQDMSAGSAQRQDTQQDLQMEITWEPGLKGTTEDLVKKKTGESSESTPWEEFLEKKKTKKKNKKSGKTLMAGKDESGVVQTDQSYEAFSDDDLPTDVGLEQNMAPKVKGKCDKGGKKKREKKKKNEKVAPEEEEKKKKNEAELALLLMDEDDEHQHFSLKKIQSKETKECKKKWKKKHKLLLKESDCTVQDTFQMDVADPRFTAVFDNPLFNIDPSAPEFKKTKGADALVQEKIQRHKMASSRSKRKEALETNIKRKDGPKTSSKAKGDVDRCATRDAFGKPVKKLRMCEDGPVEGSSSGQTEDGTLAMLVKSVKAKTKSAQQKRSLKS